MAKMSGWSGSFHGLSGWPYLLNNSAASPLPPTKVSLPSRFTTFPRPMARSTTRSLKLSLIMKHLAFCGFSGGDLAQLEAVVRAKRHAPATVYTDKGVADGVEIDSIHGAGLGAFSAADAEVLFDYDAAALALRVGTG